MYLAGNLKSEWKGIFFLLDMSLRQGSSRMAHGEQEAVHREEHMGSAT